MAGLVEHLLELRPFKLATNVERSSLLSFLFITNLWIPMRARMVSDCKEREKKPEKAGPQQSVGDTCVPKLPALGLIYYCLSMGAHLANTLTCLMIKLRNVPKDRVAADPFHCYMPRLHVHETIGQKYLIWYSLLASALLLIWKSSLAINGYNMRLDVIPFLLAAPDGGGGGKSKAQIDLLFCAMDSGRRRLRPNRTQAARRALIKQANFNFILVIAVSLLAACILIPFTAHQVASKHELIFEGCLIYQSGPIYWYRTLSSLCLALIMQTDVYLQFALGIGTLNVMVSDLMLYWSYIERRLLKLNQLLVQQAEDGTAAAAWQPLNQRSLIGQLDTKTLLSYSRHLQIRTGFLVAQSSSPSATAAPAAKATNTKSAARDLKQQLIELRTLLNDFFCRLRDANEFVSMAAALLITFWLAMNAVTTLTGLQFDRTTSNPYAIRILQLVNLSFIAILSQALVRLERHTRPAYTSICSLMALDPGARKSEWVESLSFYTDRAQCYAFTFASSVFNKFMLCKLISYTLSLVMFFETMRHR